MKYIFLDVDGVLNNHKHYKKQHEKYGGKFACENMPFNPRSLKNLRKIIDELGGKWQVKIVLTSSWRHSDRCMTVLEARLIEYGMKLYGVINPESYSCDRGKEIKEWIHSHGNTRTVLYADNKEYQRLDDQFIIIDDETYDIYDYYDESYVVKVNWEYGLTYFKTREAIKKMRLQEDN